MQIEHFPICILGGLAGLFCCLIVLVQDFRNRSIHILPLIILFGAGILFSRGIGRENLLLESFVNVLFILLIFLFVKIFYKMRGVDKIMDTKIGWGDLAMFVAIATWIEPLGYILFYSFSLVLILLLIGIVHLFRKIKPSEPIPLAGLLSIMLFIFLPLWELFQSEIEHLLFPGLST